MLPYGGTVSDILRASGIRSRCAHVWVNDEYVYPDRWDAVVPPADSRVEIRVVPAGGGDGGKNILRIVAAIVVAVVAWYAGGWAAAAGIVAKGGLGQALITGVVGALGMMAVNALIPPVLPGMATIGGGGEKESFPGLKTATGTRNTFAPYAPIPRVLGRVKCFPHLAAKPYSEYVGGKQYLRLLLTPGYMPLAIDNLKIGDMPLEVFGDELTYEVKATDADPAITLYTNDITEQNPNTDLPVGGDWVPRALGESCRTITLDVAAPSGLVYMATNGTKIRVTLTFEVQTSIAGADSWSYPTIQSVSGSGAYAGAGKFTLTGKSGVGVTSGITIVMPAEGFYDLRIRRTATVVEGQGSYDSLQIIERAHWATLRAVKPTAPVTMDGIALIALRIPGEKVNGITDQISCEATSIVNVFDGANWATAPSENPAWVYLDVLGGPATRKKIGTSRLDPADFKDWADWCDAQGFTYGEYVTSGTTVFAQLQKIAAAGLGAFGMRDGLYSVVRDIPQTTPVQHFTPRNSWGFMGTKVFEEEIHGIRVRFTNPDKGWDLDEVVAYRDGYSSANASLFETLELTEVHSPLHAWKVGRYHLAQYILRPERYELQTDIEFLRCVRGSMVRVTHDVPLWGSGCGARIKEVLRVDPEDPFSDAMGCVLDDLVAMEENKTYVLRVRNETGESVVIGLDTVAGETRNLTFATLVTGIEAGDLAMFGESGRESTELTVYAIEPGADLTARLILVDHAPNIFDCWTGEIPDFDAGITAPVDFRKLPPQSPVILGITSDETVIERQDNGVLVYCMAVSFTASGGSIAVDRVEAQYRQASDPIWRQVPAVDPDTGRMLISNVENGESYVIRVRSVSAWGVASQWTSTEHIVIGDSSPPGQVTGFSWAIEAGQLLLRWSRTGDVDVDLYEVRRGGASWEAADAVVQAAATSTLLPVDWSGELTWWVAAIDRNGHVGPAASLVVNISHAGPTVITPVVSDNHVLLYWNAVAGTLPTAEYEVRRGLAWATAEIVGRKRGTFTTVQEQFAGSFTYWVAAVDAVGMGAPASITVTVAEPGGYRLYDDYYSDFSGIKTNCFVESGILLAPVSATQTWAQHFTTNGWTTPQQQIDAGFPIFAQPSAASATYVEQIDYGITLQATTVNVLPTVVHVAGGCGVAIDIAVAPDSGGSPGTWTNYPGTSQVFATGFRFVKVTLTITPTNTQSLISIPRLNIKLDVRRKTAAVSGTAISTDSSGTWIDFDDTWIDIQAIIPSPKGGTAKYATADWTDPNPTGCYIKLWSETGTRVSGDFSAIIEGV